MIRLSLFLFITAIDTTICAFTAMLGGIINPYSRFNTSVTRIWARIILLTAGIKLHIEGAEHLQPGESYVVVSNHQSLMDIPVLIWGLPVSLRIIAKQELFKIPVFGWGMKGVGMLQIDRSNQKKSFETLKKAEKIIRSHQLSILAFPEGTRSEDGKIHPFKKGPFILALNTGLSLLPVSVSGTRQTIPKGKIQINPGRVQIKIHPPIPVKGVEMAQRNELVGQAQKVIEEGFIEGYS